MYIGYICPIHDESFFDSKEQIHVGKLLEKKTFQQHCRTQIINHVGS